MSQEITLSGSLSFTDATGATDSLQTPSSTTDSPGSLTYIKQKQSVTTSPVALNLGGLASLGWLEIINRDTTNYVTVLNQSSGKVIGKILPGKSFGPIYCGTDVTAPFVQANTATCLIEFLACAQ